MGCSSTHIFQPQALGDSSFEGDLQQTHGPSAWVSQETEENLKIKQETNTEQGHSSLSTPGEMILCSSPAKWEKKKRNREKQVKRNLIQFKNYLSSRVGD